MPEWMLTTRPPTITRQRWHTLNTKERQAAVKGYWRGLREETRHMLTLKGNERRKSAPAAT